MGYNGKPFFLLFDSNLYELTDEGLELKRYLEGDSSSEKYFDEKYYSYDYDELSGTLYFIDAGTHKVITYSLETDELEEFDLDNVDPWIPSADKIKYIGGKLYVFNNKHDGKCTVFVISIPNDGDSDVNISEIGQIEHSCDIVMESNGVLYAISADGVMSKMRLDGPQKDYSKVAIGKEHSIYIKDDVAYTKGYNTYGQLGTGSNGSKDKYEIVDGIFERVTSVAAGDYTSYIITENNNLYAFGKNDKGQLGDGTTRNSSTPKFITSNVLKISAGAEHAVIMKTDGKAYAFGSNNHKQISSLDVEYYASPQYISNANNVSAGAYHTLLCGTYGLKTLGDNTYGQLGQINGQNIIMPNIGDIAAGKEHSAIISNGKIHTVGNNNYGQLSLTPEF